MFLLCQGASEVETFTIRGKGNNLISIMQNLFRQLDIKIAFQVNN